MATWRFILTDLAGVEVGEIFQARGRKVTLPLNGLPTVTFSVDLINPMADVILGASAMQRINLLLKAYRNGQRLFVGPLSAAEEVATGDEDSLSVTASGPLWRLYRRMVGRDTIGYADGTPLAHKDLGEIAGNMIQVTNAVDGFTGIDIGVLGASSSSYLERVYFKKIAEAILELGPGLLGGYDFEIAPVEPVDLPGQGLKIGTFNTAGALGQTRPNAVFEHGTGKRNVSGYRRPIAGEVTNRVWMLPPGFPDSSEPTWTMQTASDPVSIAARQLQEEAIASELGPNDLRAKLGQEHIRIRKQPRELVIWTPAPNIALEYGVDYTVGDIVEGRAVRNGRVRYDAFFRLFGAEFDIGDLGGDQLALTMVSE